MREKTNSITHLVKIVANEIFHEKLLFLTTKVDSLTAQINELDTGVPKELRVDFHEKLCAIQSSLSSAGASWEKNEKILLQQELSIAIAQIAKNHDRTTGAILARIRVDNMI